jgi:hypothetical protein
MSVENKTQGPPLGRKVINLARAVTRHLNDGVKKVDDTVYQKRLATCRACSSCDLERMVCLEMNCGCKLSRKARWRSEDCPLNKWVPNDEKLSNEDQPQGL